MIKPNIVYKDTTGTANHMIKIRVFTYVAAAKNAVGTATRYGMDDPGFQPQWWQNKHYQSTSLHIAVFKQCKNITW
jgi:hypothetical protein